MVSIKTGSTILLGKNTGILRLLNGSRQEEVEERLNGPWKMKSGLWEADTPPG